jgi:hypothetical protein
MGLQLDRLLSTITRGTAARGVVTTLTDAVAEQAFGPGLGTTLGALASRDSVANRFGLAVGMGVMDAHDPFIKSMYDMEQQFGAGAAARGGAQVKAALGMDTNAALIDGIAKGIENVIAKFLPQIVSAIGDGIRSAILGT